MITIRFDVNDSGLRDKFLRYLLLNALAPLSEDEMPRWGRMTPQQMVEHLVWAFELSTGQEHSDCPFSVPERERAMAFLYDDRPSPREFMNPALVAGIPPLRYASLVDAKIALGVEVRRFLQQLTTTPDGMYTHQVFGPIGVEEWSRTHFKHGYHHLLQFGLLEEE